MNTDKLLRNFLARICEKNYSQAESLIKQILIEKMTKRVKEKHKKIKEKMKKISSDEDDK